MKIKLNYPTLQDFLAIRGISRVQLASMLKMTEKTIDRWCVSDVPHPSTLAKLAKLLGINYDEALALIRRGHVARRECSIKRGIRYSIALAEYCEGKDNVNGEDRVRVRKMLKRLRTTVDRAVASLSTTETKHGAV